MGSYIAWFHHRIEWDGVPVMVWFGGQEDPDEAEVVLLKTFLDKNATVFPVVEDLNTYHQNIPEELGSINGQEWDLERVVADILRAFRLSRKLRQAFISYRRRETRIVAVQLFAELSMRGYRTFLDTASIESGVDFQEALWGRMADVDLLIFLDSPQALSSRWIKDELTRAHTLGLGVLQLIWPNHQRTSGTEFCESLALTLSDFQMGTAELDDRLNPSALNTILAWVEYTRIRSLNSRRTRVVAEVVALAQELGFDPKVHPVEAIDLFRDSSRVARVVPFVGLPDAPAIQEQLATLNTEDSPNTRIVYNGLGIAQDYEDHLEWLNQIQSLQTSQVDLIGDWLEDL